MIDAEASPPEKAAADGGAREPVQLLVRFNQRALDRLRSQLELYWAEKSSELICSRCKLTLEVELCIAHCILRCNNTIMKTECTGSYSYSTRRGSIAAERLC